MQASLDAADVVNHRNGHGQTLLRALTTRMRMAAMRGNKPAATPTAKATTRPTAKIDPGSTRFGSILAKAVARTGVATTANKRPNNPPNSAIARDSARTKKRTARSE